LGRARRAARSEEHAAAGLRLFLLVRLKVLVDDGHRQQDACARRRQLA